MRDEWARDAGGDAARRFEQRARALRENFARGVERAAAGHFGGIYGACSGCGASYATLRIVVWGAPLVRLCDDCARGVSEILNGD